MTICNRCGWKSKNFNFATETQTYTELIFSSVISVTLWPKLIS